MLCFGFLNSAGRSGVEGKPNLFGGLQRFARVEFLSSEGNCTYIDW